VVVHANLFGRIVRVAKSYVNQLVTSAEDPERILEQAVEDMRGDLQKLRQGAAEVVASQKRVQARYESSANLAEEWYLKAEKALKSGQEDLAREALSRRKQYQDTANQLKAQLDQQQVAVDTILSNRRTLENKLQEAMLKKDTLKARAQSAKSARAIGDLVSGLNTGSSMAAFEKMEEKVMAMEAEAEAIGVLAAPSDEMEARFAALEGNDVDSELAKMKGALTAARGPPAALPPGRPLKDAIDVELDELRRRQGGA
jgi:phage shock protein A